MSFSIQLLRADTILAVFTTPSQFFTGADNVAPSFQRTDHDNCLGRDDIDSAVVAWWLLRASSSFWNRTQLLLLAALSTSNRPYHLESVDTGSDNFDSLVVK